MGIHRLSVQLANQIAAGEVVERQSSVVKELLENAVDAKADDIKCYLEGAGRILIRVSDNGSGIPCDELELALAPHATSKISSTEDLENIQTLGFRGEALASIASVTKLTLTSRTKDEQDGYQVSCEGPQMEASVIPAPHGVGTTVEARELFFNTPARRRFLRSDRTELGRIKDVFIRCALAHPEISFELFSDNKSLIKVRKASDEISRLKRMAYLAGGEFSKDSVSVKSDDPLLKIDGIALAGADASQGGTEKIFLFLNSRPVADKTVVHAVREAYSEFYGKGQAARCVLYLSCSPHECDVNVHPRKDEVRFHHARDVHDLISQTLLQAFEDNRPKKSQDDLLGFEDEGAVLAHASSIKPTAVLESSELDLEPKSALSANAFPSGLGGFFQKRGSTPANVTSANTALENATLEKVSSNNVSLNNEADGGSSPNNNLAEGTANFNRIISSDDELQADLKIQKRNAEFKSMIESHAKASRVQLDPYQDEEALAENNAEPEDPVSSNADYATAQIADGEIVEDKGNENEFNAHDLPQHINVKDAVFNQEQVPDQNHNQSLDQVIIERMSERTAFIRRNGLYLLVNLLALKQHRAANAYADAVAKNGVATHALSIPFALRPQEGLIKALKKVLASAERCGFKLKILRNQISVLTVPDLIKDVELSSFCSKAFAVIASSDELVKGRCPKTLADLIAGTTVLSIADSEINELLSSLNIDDEQNRALCRVLDIKKAVATFEEQI